MAAEIVWHALAFSQSTTPTNSNINYCDNAACYSLIKAAVAIVNDVSLWMFSVMKFVTPL